MSNSIFGIDLYPTPREVIERMLEFSSVSGKTILEPSAGTGNIVTYCQEMGAKDVITCEIDNRLAKLLSDKCNVIEGDFLKLTAERVSHIDMIIMNPPFSRDEDHILHAWDIAPAGCEIIALCNYSVLDRSSWRSKKVIQELIKLNGTSQSFGDCFSNSERKTGVQIGCIRLHKPGAGESEFNGFFDLYDYEKDQVNQSGIVRYDFVQDIVSRYVEAVSMFDEVEQANIRINNVIQGVNKNFNISFGAKQSGRNNEYTTIDRDTFKKELQKSAWKRLFDMLEMDKYVTSGVMSEINKFVEQQVHVPFTVRNVYLMIQMIAGTHSGRMDKVICEAFDKICSFSYENSTAGEGWRTNTDFLINKRFILPYMTEFKWKGGGMGISHYRSEFLNDIIKALCFLTGKSYDSQPNIRDWFNYPYRIECDGELLFGYQNQASHMDDWSFKNKVEVLRKNGHEVKVFKVCDDWGTWTEWTDFFRVKGFKKGTMHFEFKDEALWAKFNQRVAEIRGWKNMVTHTKKGREKRK